MYFRVLVFLLCVCITTVVHGQCFDATTNYTTFYVASQHGTTYGQSVALSGDGATMITGDPGNFRVLISRKNSTAFNSQQTLTGISGSYFGYAVALSADGLTLIVGAYQDSLTFTNQGIAYMYIRNTTKDLFETGGYFIPSAPFASQHFGYAVAVSDDGNVIAIGSNSGMACAFYSNRELIGCAAGSGIFGSTLALSGDGSTLMIGSSTFNSNKGEVYYYSVSSTSVTLQQPILPVSNSFYYFGKSLALSTDGSTLVVTASKAAYWYKKQGTQYVYRGTLTPNLSSYSTYGVAAAMNGNGEIVGITDPYYKKLYLFHLPSGEMFEQLYSSYSSSSSYYLYGQSLAMSGDGSMISVGAPYSSYSTSTCNVFVYQGPALPPANSTSVRILIGEAVAGATNNTRFYSTPSANVTALMFSLISTASNDTCLYVATGYEPTINHYDKMNCTASFGFVTFPYDTSGKKSGKSVYSYIGGPLRKNFLFSTCVYAGLF